MRPSIYLWVFVASAAITLACSGNGCLRNSDCPADSECVEGVCAGADGTTSATGSDATDSGTTGTDTGTGTGTTSG